MHMDNPRTAPLVPSDRYSALTQYHNLQSFCFRIIPAAAVFFYNPSKDKADADN